MLQKHEGGHAAAARRASTKSWLVHRGVQSYARELTSLLTGRGVSALGHESLAESLFDSAIKLARSSCTLTTGRHHCLDYAVYALNQHGGAPPRLAKSKRGRFSTLAYCHSAVVPCSGLSCKSLSFDSAPSCSVARLGTMG